MRTRSKLLLAALTATALMSLAVSDASARRLWLSRDSNYRIVWTSLRFLATGTTVLCGVTLEGSFHSRTISKVMSALIGYVTSAYVQTGECTNGSARALIESLPWHLQYLGFTGTLPIIEGIRIILVGARFRIINGSGLACLAGTTQANPGGGIANVEPNVFLIFTFTADGSRSIPLERTGFLCELAGSGRFEGVAEVFAQGSTTTRLLIRLVQ